MYNRDYLKKQTDQLAQALQKLLNDVMLLKQQGKAKESMTLISEQMQEALGLDLEKLAALEPRALLHLLNEEKKLSPAHVNSIAEIIYEIAAIEQEGMGKSAGALYLKALTLYQFLITADTSYSLDRHFKIEHIQRLLHLTS